MRLLGRIVRGLHDDGTCCGSVRSAFRKARPGVVNNLVLKNSLWLGFGGKISEPGAQTVVNGGFTMSAKLFNIRIHPDEKPPEGCEPCDGGFSMLDRRRAWVKGLMPTLSFALPYGSIRYLFGRAAI